MTGIANALEEPIIADVAAYYAGQPKRNPNPATLGELPEAIVRLVELGDPNRNIPPCATGRDRAAPSRPRSCPSKAVSTWRSSCECTPLVSAATTSMRGCEPLRRN